MQHVECPSMEPGQEVVGMAADAGAKLQMGQWFAVVQVLSRSHKGAAGMRSVLTFVKVVWIVDARVER
jgi:hypothetical protein